MLQKANFVTFCYMVTGGLFMARLEKSRKYICDAMLMLLKKKKYDDITINDIVNKAGVSRMTFYRQFYDKKEIIRAIIEERTNEYLSKIKGTEITKETLILSFESLIASKEFTRRIIEADLYNLSKEQFDKVVDVFIKDGYKAYFISGGIANIYYRYVINDDNYTALELTDILLEMLNLYDFNKDNK